MKLMGKRKYILRMTLGISIVIFFLLVIYFGIHYLFLDKYMLTIEESLFQVFFAVIVIFLNMKIAEIVWDKNKIKFDGLNSVIKEVKDEELKSLILKNEKIKAANRYKVITGSKLIESLRYIELIKYYYSISYLNNGK